MKALSGGVGLLVALLCFIAATPAAATLSSRGLPVWLDTCVWLTAMVVVPILGVLVARGAWRWWQIDSARRTRRRDRAVLAADSATCRCWALGWNADEAGRSYVGEHLRMLPLDPQLEVLSAVSDHGTWLAECPQSGIRWLSFQTTVEGGFINLRGAAQHQTQPVAADPR